MENKKKQIKIKIGGMTCASCVRRVENSLKNLKGILNVNVNLATESAIITYDENFLKIDNIKKRINDIGYKFLGISSDESYEIDEKEKKKYIDKLKKRVYIGFGGGILLLFLMYGEYLGLNFKNFKGLLFLQLLIAAPLMVYVGGPIFKKALNGIKNKDLNMDVMYAIGIGSSFFSSLLATFKIIPENYNFYEASVLLAAFLTLGRLLENLAKNRTGEAIKKLIDLRPKEATVLKDGKELKIPIKEVKPGDILLVKPGEKIPTDGIVIEGESFLDESMVRGEPIPEFKKKGDEVIGGTINQNGYLKITVTKDFKETFLSQVIKLVEEAQYTKPQVQKLADRIVIYFIPVVLIIAIFSYIFWRFFGNVNIMPPSLFAFISLISVLVIACPCAFGLATPTAITAGIGKGAELGILIRNGEALETLKKINTIIFDKTGTLTKGKPEVESVITFNNIKEEELILYAASAEKNSEHPLAKSILNYTEKIKINLIEPEKFESFPGKGIRAIIKGKEVYVGNKNFLREIKIEINEHIEKEIEKLEEEAKTLLLVAIDGKIKGIIAVSDKIKENAKEIISYLKKKKKKVYMITGDTKKSAEAVARKLSIDNVIAEVLPHEKREKVKELQKKGEIVAFIGDGINDSPALTQADVGIALGSGTDIAIESGDIVLLRDDLRDVIIAMELSIKTLNKIKQNIFWALIYNLILIPFAAGLFYLLFRVPFRPEWSAAAMALSSISVVTNSLLLKKYKPSLKI
ncbi:MAG: heavy metal translocating P-type ATPase [candidate division WOR-3 bacterium]